MDEQQKAKNPFEYQKPTERSISAITHVREQCKDLYDTLLALAPSRERSLAITKLEEVSMWANKGIVFNQTEQSDCDFTD